MAAVRPTNPAGKIRRRRFVSATLVGFEKNTLDPSWLLGSYGLRTSLNSSKSRRVCFSSGCAMFTTSSSACAPDAASATRTTTTPTVKSDKRAMLHRVRVKNDADMDPVETPKERERHNRPVPRHATPRHATVERTNELSVGGSTMVCTCTYPRIAHGTSSLS